MTFGQIQRGEEDEQSRYVRNMSSIWRRERQQAGQAWVGMNKGGVETGEVREVTGDQVVGGDMGHMRNWLLLRARWSQRRHSASSLI